MNIQEIYRNPNRLVQKRNCSHDIIIKTPNAQNKERILKAVRGCPAQKAVEGEKPCGHICCLQGHKRITRYCNTLSFSFLVVQTARGQPALRNWAHRRFICKPVHHRTCVLCENQQMEWPPLHLRSIIEQKENTWLTLTTYIAWGKTEKGSKGTKEEASISVICARRNQVIHPVLQR